MSLDSLIGCWNEWEPLDRACDPLFVFYCNHGVCRIQDKNSIDIPGDFRNKEGEGEGQELECRSGIELSNLWLDAGRFSEGLPSQQDWEVTHVREEVLGARSSAAISGKLEFGNNTRDLVTKHSNAKKGESRATHFNFDSIQVRTGLALEAIFKHTIYPCVFKNTGA